MSEALDPPSPALAGELSPQALLRQARTDRAAARASLRALAPQTVAALCQELRPELRSEFLMLVEHPEEVVPRLDETALAITVRSTGMSEAAWLLELASPEQRRACVDLDCWDGDELQPARVVEWIEALIEAGRPTLVHAVQELDPEVWLLAVRELGEVVVVGREDEPPEGFATEDGVVYFRAHSDEGFARLREILQATFAEAQPHYWGLVYGLLFELPAELEEHALHWRDARLNDLGFPGREQAMQVYRPLRVEQAESYELGGGPRETALTERVELPRVLRGTLVGDALAELPHERATDLLGYILGVANAIAVADKLRLSEPESVPRALRKAVAGIDRGLRELVRSRAQDPPTVLDQSRPADLFRIGATLDPELRKP